MGHTETVRRLLQSGADPNIVGGECGTALLAASTKGYINIVRLLLDNGADVNLANVEARYNPLKWAMFEDKLETFKLLLEKGANVNSSAGAFGTVIVEASFHGKVEFVKLLLEHGADLNANGEYGTALRAARKAHYLDIPGKAVVVQMLLEHGAVDVGPDPQKMANMIKRMIERDEKLLEEWLIKKQPVN